MFGNYAAQAGVIAIQPKKDYFWDFSDPKNKVLSNFNISFSNGSITINWNDGTLPTNILSGVDYSHTFN
jgi:hypothetical protein